MVIKITRFKNHISAKRTNIGIGFVIFLFGYLLGFLKAHKLLFNIIPNVTTDTKLLNWLKEWIMGLVPNPVFLSDVSAFTGVIIGLTIPFTIDLILRVADRFKSEKIPLRFKNEYEVKYLPYYLIFIINWAVFMRFLTPDNSSSYKWLIVTLILFITLIVWFTQYMRRIKIYALDKNKLKKELSKDILRSIAKKDQNKFLNSLESYGDIAVFETDSSNYEKVLDESLPFLEEQILFLISENSNKTGKLLYSPEYYNSFDKESEEKKFRVYFNPDKYLIGFATSLNQINRIYWKGLNREDDDKLSRNAVYSIVRILSKTSTFEDKHIFVEQLLQRLQTVMIKAIEKNDASMYSAAIHWYTDIVFNKLATKRNFKLSYLDLFDRYFFSSVRYIVARKHTLLFQSLISMLVDGIVVPSYNKGRIYDYVNIIHHKDLQKHKELDKEYNLEKRIKELANLEDNIHSQENHDLWLKKFDELVGVIKPNLNKTDKNLAREIEKEIRSTITSQYKYQNLLEIVFAIAAYCLFKRRYSYIKSLWEYKQPTDSDTNWMGHDITPDSLDDAIKFFYRKDLSERKFDFWEGHHGSEIYFKKYFLLLLARLLQDFRADQEGTYLQIENYQLPVMPVYRLSDLYFSVESLIELASRLKQEKKLLVEIGFDIEKLDEIFDDRLILFLQKLKIEAERQISAKHKEGKISRKKVEEFKNEVVKSFYDSVIIRDIFINHFQAYEDEIGGRIPNKKERLGVNIIDDKAGFFEEWHIHFVSWGENYGRRLATGEDIKLLEELKRNCKNVGDRNIISTLSRFENPNDIVLLAPRNAMWSFFEQLENFKPKWYSDFDELKINGFSGWFRFNGSLIPIFEIYPQNQENEILAINKIKAGKLIQLSPLNAEDDEELIKDIFYINLQSFTENHDLMEEFLNNPPDWLNKLGDKAEQTEYLKEKVRIQIFERFVYQKDKNFEGYIINYEPYD